MIEKLVVSVPITVPHPCYGPRQLQLVAALRHEIELIIDFKQCCGCLGPCVHIYCLLAC
jgi:hypothetical protein